MPILLTLPIALFLALLLLAPPAWAQAVQTIPPAESAEVLGQLVHVEDEGKNQEVGRIAEILVNAEGQPVAVVLDVGGFLGVGNRKVAVAWSALRFQKTKDKLDITLAVPANTVRAAPDYKGPGKPVQAVGP
ncbi:PRC-barrel domain containing protein [Rhodovastum atsumiense]|uniref:PRC-barrel domain-containing protein n=1 Tax=Rhodovastum atsumiense TaxID=504468 RepID=UPI00139F2C7C|nr:PRC-barrel domain-containing protein [Rhodovastum atsumiense]CAH2604169.1 PRC-barrel domain containing protein [Rhodovastum atsumiense]